MKGLAKGVKVFGLIVILSIASLIASCGGGGGGGGGLFLPPTGQTVSGVAAAGAPIVGFAYLRDSATPPVTRGPVTISADGSFSFNVKGLTAPFILKVEGSVGGQGVKLISFAQGAGTANVNPITNIAVAAASGQNDPSLVYDDPSAHAASMTQANVDSAIENIQTMLQALLTAYDTTTNPLTGDFTADHTGLDAVLDVVSVDLDTATGDVNIGSKVTGSTIGSGNIDALESATPVLEANVPATTTVTDLQAIGTSLANMLAVVRAKGIDLVEADLGPFYAAAFGMHNGLTRANEITQVVSDISGTASNPIIGVTNLALVSVNAGVYTVSGYMKFSDGGRILLSDLASEFVNEGGSWKIKGNGHVATTWLFPRTVKNTDHLGNETITTGIGVEVHDDGNQGILSAVVKGPGMPVEGVIYEESPYEFGKLCFNNGDYCDVTYDQMSDVTIGAIPDNAVYTVDYYLSSGGTGTLLESRSFTIAKRPYKLSELTSGSYVATSVTSHALSAAHYGGTFSFTYTLPAEYVPVQAQTELQFFELEYGAGQTLEVEKNLRLDRTSVSLTTVNAGWTPFSAYYYTNATDQYGREFLTYWGFQ